MSLTLPAPGTKASGQVQDLQGHHQDDQEQILDHFFKMVLRVFKVGINWANYKDFGMLGL